jgi:hypothetical protein
LLVRQVCWPDSDGVEAGCPMFSRATLVFAGLGR